MRKGFFGGQIDVGRVPLKAEGPFDLICSLGGRRRLHLGRASSVIFSSKDPQQDMQCVFSNRKDAFKSAFCVLSGLVQSTVYVKYIYLNLVLLHI